MANPTLESAVAEQPRAPERPPENDAAEAPITRLTVNLPTWAIERLRAFALGRGDSLTQAIKDAISVKLAIEDERKRGGRIYVERTDGSHAELLIP